MKHVKKISAVVVSAVIFFSSCKKQAGFDEVQASQDKTTTLTTQATLISPAVKAKLASMRAALPARSLQLPNAVLQQIQHPEFRDMVLSSLNAPGAAAPCNGNTPLFQWLTLQLADWDNDMRYNAYATGMYDLPFLYTVYFENSTWGQYFGSNSQYTQQSLKTFRDLKRFWDIPSAGTVLAAFHGNMLRDRNKLIRAYTVVYGLSSSDAALYADFVIYLLDNIPQYRNGNHPIFTFNAYSSPAITFNGGTVPAKISMGDGIQEAYTAIGYDDVAPQAIQAHEYGHQVQFFLNIFDNSTPELNRRIELMADAFSAFFLAHSKGGNKEWKRTKQYLQVFYNVGDCATTELYHHGTPTQRMAAAEWAYTLIRRRCHQGNLLSSREFVTLFDAALPGILAN